MFQYLWALFPIIVMVECSVGAAQQKTAIIGCDEQAGSGDPDGGVKRRTCSWQRQHALSVARPLGEGVRLM